MKYFFARQPIFNKVLEVHAYELVFRTGFEGVLLAGADPAEISSSFLNLGLDTLTGGRRASVPFPQQLIIDEIPRLFPPDAIYVSLSDGDVISDECLEKLRELRAAGYRLLFDSNQLRDPELLDLASIVRVDFSTTSPEDRKWIAETASDHSVKLLASNVDCMSVYREVLSLHFDLFHGFFFAMPEVVSGKDIPGLKVSYLDLMSEIHREELDLKRVSEIIKKDVSLTFRLLKFINSSAFGWQRKIVSVQHALVLLGHKEIRRWLTLVSLGGVATDRPDEVLRQLLVRARFCESLAPALGHVGREMDLYMLGMFSSLDAVLETEMNQVTDQVPLADEVKAALAGESGPWRDVLELVLAYERGKWESVHELSLRLAVNEEQLPDRYQDALRWVANAFEDRELVS